MSYYFRKLFPTSEQIAQDSVQSIEHHRDQRYKYSEFQANPNPSHTYNFFQQPQYQSKVRYMLQVSALRPLSEYQSAYNTMAKNPPLLPAME